MPEVVDPSTQTAPEPPKKTQAQDLLAQVADTIKNSSGTVRTKLMELMVERKIDERVEILDKGLKLLDQARSDLNKLRPDQITFGTDGKKQENFSKSVFEQRGKAQESLTRVEKAIEQALSGESFDKLKELVNKGGQKPQNDPREEGP